MWVWIRPQSESDGHVRAALWWGVLGLKVDQACGPEGLVVSSPVSTDHPALFVQMLDAPAWVDFGHGVFPQSFGVPNLAALPHLDFFGVGQAATSAFSDALHSNFGFKPNLRAPIGLCRAAK